MREPGERVEEVSRFAYLALHYVAGLAQQSVGKKYNLAAAGERKDGAWVEAKNGATLGTPLPAAHAEARLCKKLDTGATVYVARVTRDGKWAMARPCAACRVRLRAKMVKMVYYTIGENEWGTLEL